MPMLPQIVGDVFFFLKINNLGVQTPDYFEHNSMYIDKSYLYTYTDYMGTTYS